jgi:type II secretory pathway pseudopilin PulG
LVELILVVAILSAMAFIAVPRLQYGAVDRKRADATVQTLVSSMRRTRSRALRDAVTAPRGFTLALAEDGSQRAYEIKHTETGVVVDRHPLPEGIEIEVLDGSVFCFGPYGSLQPGSATQLRVIHAAGSALISVTGATGRVTVIPDESR